MAFDIDRARAETPGCAHVLHFDNAGAALPPVPVIGAVAAHLSREAEIGGYAAADEAAELIEHTYDAVAALLGAGRDEIALVENATRAWDMAFYALRLAPGDRILTARAEYASNAIAMSHLAQRTGVVIEVVPDDAEGQIDLAALASAIDRRTRLVALTHVPTGSGLVNPAAAVGAIARDAGVPFLLDACQSAGQLPLDVEALGCDMLVATGRKFLRGPRGTGFLYVRRELADELDPPFLDLRSARWKGPGRYEVEPGARRFETWESCVAGRIGLGVAVDYAMGWGLDTIAARVGALAADVREQLSAQPGVTVLDRGPRLCGIVTFTSARETAEALHVRLRAAGINTSVSAPRHSPFAGREVSAVRASVHYYNTTGEIARFCDTVAGSR